MVWHIFYVVFLVEGGGCTGSIRLITEAGVHHNVNRAGVRNVKRHFGLGSFPVVTEIRVDGTCCWKIYENLNCRSGSVSRFGGSSAGGQVGHGVKSVERVDC